MKTWKHLNFRQRKIISCYLLNNKKLITISKMLSKDPRSISKEVKRNRIAIDYSESSISNCSTLNKWPFTCSNCHLRYSKNCKHIKFKYDACIAQRKTDYNLIFSRKDIDLIKNKFNFLDSIIKNSTINKKSIYQIKLENSDKITQSISTLYRYINKGFLSTKKLNLPYSVK